MAREKMDVLAGIAEVGEGNQLPRAVERLNARLGLPATLGQLGLIREDLEPLAAKALRDHCTPTNPRALSQEDCHNLYQEAL